ncbi:MAG: dual specificity protein phosphatase family protein [Sphingomicrobium sp.]
MPDFHWIADDLAVGGSFPDERAHELAEAHGVGAVVDLRAEEQDDEDALRSAGITFLHLPTPDLNPATADHLDKGVEFVRAQRGHGRKVLIHCQHGIGRSALLALCVLVDAGADPLTALAQAKDRRGRISPSESQYHGWAEWLRRHGHQVPDYHSFGCIAYRQLSQG